MRSLCCTAANRTRSSCDPGRGQSSQTSLILGSFAGAIGLVGEDSPLQLGTINSSGKPVRSRKVSFYVGATGGSEASAQIAVEKAWTVPQLNLTPQKVRVP